MQVTNHQVDFFQLGELLFVDLKKKMIVASCDVKDSIMSMELMQDKQHETTSLLVIITKCQCDVHYHYFIIKLGKL